MDQKHTHHGGIGNGFLLGFLVGVLLTLMFTTKKGREVLRLLTEKGLEKFSELEKVLEDTEEVDDESDYVAPEDTKGSRFLAKVDEHTDGVNSHSTKSAKTRNGLRRFFRKK